MRSGNGLLRDYSSSFRDESQNAFFDKNQVTLRPMMLYYKPPESPIVKHAIIAITDDSIKDASAVKVFESEAIAIAKSQINLHHVHEWTDGCSSQYKGKNSFFDLSVSQHNVTRNFFETSHGKSVCDGLGSIVKNSALWYVYSGKVVIATAEDLYEFCKSHLEHGRKTIKKDRQSYVSVRQFIFVKQSDVVHMQRNVKLRPLSVLESSTQ